MKKSKWIFGIVGFLIGIIASFGGSFLVVKRIAGKEGETNRELLERYGKKLYE